MNEKGEIIMPFPLILGGGFGCDMDGLVSGLSVREIAANRIMNKKRKKGETKEVDTKGKVPSKKSDDSKNTDEN